VLSSLFRFSALREGSIADQRPAERLFVKEGLVEEKGVDLRVAVARQIDPFPLGSIVVKDD